MAKFLYKAKRGVDELLEGEIEASSQEDAMDKILQKGLFPVELRQEVYIQASHPSKVSSFSFKRWLSKRKVSSKEVLIFTQKLATLTNARVELFTGLKILYDQTEESLLKEVILQIYHLTKEGKSFSQSLQHFPSIFSSFYINIVKAGEASGRLDIALQQIGEFLYKQNQLKNKVKVALAYPALLSAVGIASIFILINFVIPKLSVLLEGLGKELPLITRVILFISKASFKMSMWVIPVIFLMIVLLLWLRGPSFFKGIAKKMGVRIPLVRKIFLNQEFAHFSRSLGLLVKSGVPAITSLEISIANIEDEELKRQLGKVCDMVAHGETISESMEKVTKVPVFFIKMIAIGEASGRLVEVLESVSNSYSQEVESDIALVSSLLEPFLILFLGLILGTIIFSIILPIFQITQFVQ